MCSRLTCRRLTTAWLALGLMFSLLSCAGAEDEAGLFKAALDKHRAKDDKAASELLVKFAAQYPSSPDAPRALLMLGYIKLKTSPQATSETLDAFSQVRTKYPKSPEAGEALVRIGYIHGRTDTGQAIKDFQEFVNTYKDHQLVPEAQTGIGKYYYRLEDWDKSEAALKKVLDLPKAPQDMKDDAALTIALINTERFFRSGDRAQLDKTIAGLEKLTSSSSLWVRGNADLGIPEALLYQAKYPEALEKYTAIAKKYEKEPYYHVLALFGAGCACQGATKTEEAAAQFAAVLAALPGATVTEKDKAWRDVALQTRPPKVREKLQKEGSSFHGDTVLVQSAWSYASSLYHLKQYDKAAGILRELLQCPGATGSIKFTAQRTLEACEKAKGGK